MADDDDLVGDTLYDLLTYLGYSILRARSGEEAWDLFQHRRVRAVITDYRFSRGPAAREDGLALAARVKRASPETPVIMLSGTPPEAAGAICDAVLRKPLPIRLLIGTLERLNIGAA